jgi:hypothetical protein
MLQHPAGTVPSLFRQMLISSGCQRREPTSTEITGQMTYRRYSNHRQKFEMYFDC